MNGKTGYKHTITSKYYETDVILFPFLASEALTDVSESFLESVEGVIIYFDPSRVRVGFKMSKCCDFNLSHFFFSVNSWINLRHTQIS